MYLGILDKLHSKKGSFAPAELKRLAIFAPKLTHDRALLAQLIPHLEGDIRSECLEEAFAAACADSDIEAVDYLAGEIEKLEGKERIAAIIDHNEYELIKHGLEHKNDPLTLHLVEILEKAAPDHLHTLTSGKWLAFVLEKGAAGTLKHLFNYIRRDEEPDGPHIGSRYLEEKFDSKDFHPSLGKAAYSDNADMLKLLLDTAGSFSPDGKPYYYARSLASLNRDLYTNPIRNGQTRVAALLLGAAHKLGGNALVNSILSNEEIAEEVGKHPAITRLARQYQQGNHQPLLAAAGHENPLLHTENYTLPPLEPEAIETKYQEFLKKHRTVKKCKKAVLAEINDRYPSKLESYDYENLLWDVNSMNIATVQELLAVAERVGGREFVKEILEKSALFWHGTLRASPASVQYLLQKADEVDPHGKDGLVAYLLNLNERAYNSKISFINHIFATRADECEHRSHGWDVDDMMPLKQFKECITIAARFAEKIEGKKGIQKLLASKNFSSLNNIGWVEDEQAVVLDLLESSADADFLRELCKSGHEFIKTALNSGYHMDRLITLLQKYGLEGSELANFLKEKNYDEVKDMLRSSDMIGPDIVKLALITEDQQCIRGVIDLCFDQVVFYCHECPENADAILQSIRKHAAKNMFMQNCARTIIKLLLKARIGYFCHTYLMMKNEVFCQE